MGPAEGGRDRHGRQARHPEGAALQPPVPGAGEEPGRDRRHQHRERAQEVVGVIGTRRLRQLGRGPRPERVLDQGHPAVGGLRGVRHRVVGAVGVERLRARRPRPGALVQSAQLDLVGALVGGERVGLRGGRGHADQDQRQDQDVGQEVRVPEAGDQGAPAALRTRVLRAVHRSMFACGRVCAGDRRSATGNRQLRTLVTDHLLPSSAAGLSPDHRRRRVEFKETRRHP